MKSEAKVEQPLLLKRLAFIFAIVTIVGFIPWDSLLSLDIRDYTARFLIDGVVGFAGLFLLVAIIFIMLLRYDKWFTGWVVLGFPVILLGIAAVGMLGFVFSPSNWNDDAIYKNGDKYLILQSVYYGRDDINAHYRLIDTSNPYSDIRVIKVIKTRFLDNEVDKFHSMNLTYAGKIWYKQKPVEE